jgi:mycoredoxin
MSSQRLTVLGADWCGDCRRSKMLLNQYGIDFDDVDLVAHPDRVDEVIARNNGAQSIPVIVFPDGSHVTEPSDPVLTGLLIDHGLLAVDR